MTKELEEYAIDVIKNHSHKLVKNFTETDLINRELTIFKAGYNKAKEEWHEYSERPKEKINALCFDISQNKFILGFYDLEADEWLRYGGYETINIDLWTKIEIPEFIKE